MHKLVNFTDNFLPRHIGPRGHDIQSMLEKLNLPSLDALIEETIPSAIRIKEPLLIREPAGEHELLSELKSIARENSSWRTFIGMGYYGTITPGVVQRNVLENPGWYTQYTPYQAEISQGRLEALLNYQTMVSDLTELPISNASLLDEATAAAEAMIMFYNASKSGVKNLFFVSSACHPQTIAVLKTRSKPLGIKLLIGDHSSFDFPANVFGAILQYPATDGVIFDYTDFCSAAHNSGIFTVIATDLLSLTLLKPPGEFGADAAVGNTQRFGVPVGYGGPHAAFFATREEFKRKVPGRIIGVSRDAQGNPALRMALQTREQHIRREGATSNICTSQVLLAIMAGMYAVYHGPQGLTRIANRIHWLTQILATGLNKLGHSVLHKHFFDTIRVRLNNLSINDLQTRAKSNQINLRYFEDDTIGISLDETVSQEDVNILLKVFSGNAKVTFSIDSLEIPPEPDFPKSLTRQSGFLKHSVFNSYQSETEMLRYLHRLETKDLALNTSMIPLGSCTMKLNGTTEMLSITWPEFANLHPFIPIDQAKGYQVIIRQLGEWLKAITGFGAVSMQPNSGAQGEYTGLLVIREYHRSRGDNHRNICLIPASAHGTNPASAVMAGMKVVVVSCDEDGNIDVNDLRKKAEQHHKDLAALMITYPSTHGVFEAEVTTICAIIHQYGGQVYMDGANLNAMVGLCRPSKIGADVMHINLHKTFSIPHGGGGPGMGPIVAAEHLADFLPAHPVIKVGGKKGISPVSAAPWGSANILLISWSYIALMGGKGLTEASQVAILNANYMAAILGDHFPILYKGANGRVAHEFIIDLRSFRKSCGITDEDVAKRLMDYGFHAPTMSFPVPGTLMIEPTESESKAELDRFCEALISIKQEILDVETGKADKDDNLLKNAPHTALAIASDNWNHPYSREQAAYPASRLRENKFWPAVGRVDNAYGDRNLVCVCPPVGDYR